MSRKAFAIWFAIFILLQWLLTSPLVGIHSIIELFLSMVIIAIMLSNILGIVFAGLICYKQIPEIWSYLFNRSQWLEANFLGVNPSDINYGLFFWLHDVLPLVIVLVIMLHLFLCGKRCKTIGISAWWILVPLYNPFVLLFRK